MSDTPVRRTAPPFIDPNPTQLNPLELELMDITQEVSDTIAENFPVRRREPQTVAPRRGTATPCCEPDHDGDGNCDHHPYGLTVVAEILSSTDVPVRRNAPVPIPTQAAPDSAPIRRSKLPISEPTTVKDGGVRRLPPFNPVFTGSRTSNIIKPPEGFKAPPPPTDPVDMHEWVQQGDCVCAVAGWQYWICTKCHIRYVQTGQEFHPHKTFCPNKSIHED